MGMTRRMRTLMLPASLLAAAAVLAQPGPTASVTIKGQKSAVAGTVIAAKSRVLSRNYASSCAFMSDYNPDEDDLVLDYMEEFGQDGGMSDDAEHFNDAAPAGDVSTTRDSSSFDGDETSMVKANPRSVTCGASDRAFAAARNHIARKDKSLGQAFAAFDNKDYASALDLFGTAWRKVGYEEAALMLARMHLFGLGTPADTGQAVHWLREVAEERYDPGKDRFRFDPAAPRKMNPRVEATILLAKIYLTGTGTKKDPAEAMRWYARAADIGFDPAANILGLAALSGYGGKRDPARALGYFRQAAQAGYVPAAYNLAKLYYEGDAGVPRDLKQAGAWFEAAAKAGHAGALFAAGRMYDRGEGVAADQHKAIVYYKEAALKGDRDAQFALGTYFYSGEVVPKDQATARKLFAEAAARGQADAMFNLGVMYLNGEGGPRDPAMAYAWFRLANAAGRAGAADAVAVVEPQLTQHDRERAEAMLKPQATPRDAHGG